MKVVYGFCMPQPGLLPEQQFSSSTRSWLLQADLRPTILSKSLLYASYYLTEMCDARESLAGWGLNLLAGNDLLGLLGLRSGSGLRSTSFLFFRCLAIRLL